MKLTIKISLLFFSVLFNACGEKSNIPPIDFVDPMIGTDETGHTFPGATLPFGMVQLSPSNDFKSWAWCSGYHYSDSILKGFAHTHISGAGLAGLGDFLFMPTTGDVRVVPGTENDPDSGYRSRFSHKNEEASVGYYSVLLDDYNIKVELTTTPRVGLHRYTFQEGGLVNVIIDPTHNVMERIYNTEVEIISDTELRGFKHSNGEAGRRNAYFYAKISKPFTAYGTSENDVIFNDKKKSSGVNTKSFVRFQVEPGEAIEVKVGISFVGYEGAKMNFEAEAKNKSFTQVHEEARKIWSEKINKIVIDGASNSDKRVFYTGMYHAFISPNLISDVDGNYIVEGKQYNSKFPHYSNFSTWDTYRALHPLFTIIEQDKTRDFVNSLVSRHFDSKVGLPVWELLGHDNVCMIGYNSVSPMADAVLKNIDGIDPEKVFEAIKTAAFSLEKHSPNYDKNGMEEYLNLNFVPGEVNCAVSKTTEQNYYDWCISEVAKKMGYICDEELFKRRSLGYRNLFNTDTKFLHSKYTTGEWRDMDPGIWDDLTGVYVSGNMWGYSSYVPHDMSGLIDLIGGREAFAQWLDDIFTDTTTAQGTAHVDISGFIGKYGHGDEPSHHMPYLYNYAGQPWKTQQYVRQIIDEFYSDQPNGLVNNEDLGQMSAWYIFSAIGFYPVCPGDLTYTIGTPLYGNSQINLENGRTFSVIAKNNSRNNKYIQSASLNGKAYNKSFIRHEQILEGGEFVLVMGNKPNKTWGSQEHDIPVTRVELTDKTLLNKPVITYTPFDPDKSIVFEKKRKIELTCNTPGAEIYYTTNGNRPTRNSTKYLREFEITRSTKLKAIAYANGLLPSAIQENEYFRGRSFSGLSGYPKLEVKFPAGGYGAKDGRQMMDLTTGSYHYGDGTWTGWNGDDMIATIDFGQPIDFNSVSIGYLTYTNVWIFPPKSISLFISNDNLHFKEIGKKQITIEKVHPKDPFVTRDEFILKNKSGRYLRVEVENTGTIPEWHGATGHKPWMFLDEILIN